MDCCKWTMTRFVIALFWIGMCLAINWSIFENIASVPIKWSGFPIIYVCTYPGHQNLFQLPLATKSNQFFDKSILFIVENRTSRNYHCWVYLIDNKQESNQSKQGRSVRLSLIDFPLSIRLKCPTFRLLTVPLLNGEPPPPSLLQTDTKNFSCSSITDTKIRISRSTKTLSVVTGNVVTIRCAVAGFEVKDIRWEKDSSRLPVNHRQKILQDGNLVIDNVQQEDEGSYKCTATDIKDREHIHLVVLRVIAAPTISLSDFQPDIQVGMRMKVLCSVLHGDPPFRFTWIKDGIPVSTGLGLSMQYYRDWSMLSSDNVQLSHAGNYSCVVSNEAATASQSSILRVNAPPKWTVEPHDSEVIHGKSVRIDCSAEGSPSPSITWKRATDPDHGDFSPVYNSHKYTLYANGSLVIQNADKSEEGYYLCQSNNGFGAGLSKLLFVTVHEPPRFEIKFKAHAVKKGDVATLFCQSIGDLPVKINWWKDNKLLKNETRTRIELFEDKTKKTMEATLVVLKTQSEDSGVYSCKASNSYGEDETKVQLLVQEPPGSPPNLGIVNVTGRSITVSWSEPYRGNSAITQYVLQYNMIDDTSDVQNMTVRRNQKLATITKLKPSTTYMVRITAENSVGWGEPSNWLNATTDEEAPGGPPLNVTARATGPNSIKVSWRPPKKENWHGDLSGYYVGYRAVVTADHFLYKTVQTNGADRIHEVHLTNLRRSTSYVVIVQAFNTKGAGPSSDEVTVKTLDDVPPSAPVLKLLSTTKSSITIGWSQKTAFGNPVREYLLHVRKEADLWRQIPISTQKPVYTTRNITCGTNYQFFITAHNSVGKSEPSEILYARTDGAAPLSPLIEDFISPSQNDVTLNLLSWKSGGCDITHYTIKIRQKFRRTWKTVVDELLTNHSQYVVPNLMPSTSYELHVTAHSTAGATEAQYEFKSKNVTEEITVKATPELPRPKTSPLVTDLEILIPIVVSGCVVLVVVIVGCILCSKEVHCNRRNNVGLRHSSSKYTREVVAMKELASPPLDCISSEDGTQRSSSQSTSHYPLGQSLYCTRPEDEEETQPYSILYSVYPMTVLEDFPPHSTLVSSLTRVVDRTDIIDSNRQLLRERPYEALMITSAQFNDAIAGYEIIG